MSNLSGKQLAIALGLAIALASTERAYAGEVAWRQSPRTAQHESQQSGRPVLIYIGADFCGYCRKLERTTWADDRVARTIASGFVPLHLDGQRDAGLVRNLNVQGFPAVMVLSPQGQITGRLNGFREPAEMQAFLVQHGVFVERDAHADR